MINNQLIFYTDNTLNAIILNNYVDNNLISMYITVYTSVTQKIKPLKITFVHILT